jgi:hypothetical protein
LEADWLKHTNIGLATGNLKCSLSMRDAPFFCYLAMHPDSKKGPGVQQGSLRPRQGRRTSEPAVARHPPPRQNMGVVSTSDCGHDLVTAGPAQGGLARPVRGFEPAGKMTRSLRILRLTPFPVTRAVSNLICCCRLEVDQYIMARGMLYFQMACSSGPGPRPGPTTWPFNACQ